MMLKISNLNARYGAIEALHDVNLEVNPGEIRCIIGVNGAGKTTLLKAISGFVEKTGNINWDGAEISSLSPRKIAQLGIIHVPEGRHVFPGLTVRENLEVSTISWHGFFGTKPYTEDIERVFSIFPRLQERTSQRAWSLSGGEQQMLAIGRALMSRPRLLMLDEPSMGLAPMLVEQIFGIIGELNRGGVTILLVEQNANMALRVADRGYVLETGRIVMADSASALLENDAVRKAYLGG